MPAWATVVFSENVLLPCSVTRDTGLVITVLIIKVGSHAPGRRVPLVGQLADASSDARDFFPLHVRHSYPQAVVDGMAGTCACLRTDKGDPLKNILLKNAHLLVPTVCPATGSEIFRVGRRLQRSCRPLNSALKPVTLQTEAALWKAILLNIYTGARTPGAAGMHA